jgi:hypothetical protein
MIDRDNLSILKRLVEQWNQVRAEIRRMHPGTQVRPDDINVFRPIDGLDQNVAYFELQPVVFNLPERATHAESDLFIVVEGLLSYRRAEFKEDKRLLTHSFASHAAYFRRTRDSLLHVFGAHYDFSQDELGHPAFHGQLKSFAEFGELVKQQYRVELPIADRVKGVLNRVRIPTAQMDVFSVFIQICADHLMHKGSSVEEVSAFGTLLSKSRFCVGAAFQLPRLGTEEARKCYRAPHWYPATT